MSAQLQDHIYFTLEPDRLAHGGSTSLFIPDTQVPHAATSVLVSPPPIYQEITDISTIRGRSAAGAVTANGGSNTSLSSATPPHDQGNHSIHGSGATDT